MWDRPHSSSAVSKNSQLWIPACFIFTSSILSLISSILLFSSSPFFTLCPQIFLSSLFPFPYSSSPGVPRRPRLIHGSLPLPSDSRRELSPQVSSRRQTLLFCCSSFHFSMLLQNQTQRFSNAVRHHSSPRRRRNFWGCYYFFYFFFFFFFFGFYSISLINICLLQPQQISD